MSYTAKIVEFALRYAERGWPVVPLQGVVNGHCTCGNTNCSSPGKHPRTAHGVKDATTNTAEITTWWKQWPDANVGIATGAGSRLVVLDVDPINGGNESLVALQREHGRLPATQRVRTGGGGSHLYFSVQPSQVVRNSAGTLGPGLDVRGDGGYVVAPPSRHVSGGAYQFHDLTPPVPLPDWLAEFVDEDGRMVSLPGIPGTGAVIISEGKRNSTLTSLAGSMRRRRMAPHSIEAALLAENESRCSPPLRDEEVRRIAMSVSRYQPEATTGTVLVAEIARDDAWPDPAPLGDELPAVPVLDLELVPGSLRPLIEDASDRMQAAPEYAAAAAMLSLAGCVGRRADIQPKVEDTEWRVVPNLWGAIIAPPGFMKSPMLHAITAPLTHVEAKWRAEYEAAKEDFETKKEEAELRHQAWKEQYKQAVKKGNSPPVQLEDTISAPAQRRLLLTDATFEKLHEILAQNPAGILVLRDELTGWLAELERPGREGERAFFLQAWNGDSPFTVDRIGRGCIHVSALCVSLLGNIQPARLRWYLAQALQGGPSDDGLFQRFQLMVWPDPPRDWHLVDRVPNHHALGTAKNVFSRLAALSADDPIRMRFAPDAQELFFAWWMELERKIRQGVGLSPVHIAHLAKYRSLMPTLAGLSQLADCAAAGNLELAPLIALEHAQRAAAWCDFLEPHAHRVYSCALTPELRAAHDLARHLRAGDLPRSFTTRALYLKGWTGLDTPDRVRVALALLEEAGWVRRGFTDSSPKGGRPSEMWVVNPKVGGK